MAAVLTIFVAGCRLSAHGLVRSLFLGLPGEARQGSGDPDVQVLGRGLGEGHVDRLTTLTPAEDGKAR